MKFESLPTVHRHSEQSCECHSTARLLALIAPDLQADFADLCECAEALDWHVDPDIQVITVEIGGLSAWAGPNDVANFVRGVLGTGRFEEIRAVVLKPKTPVASQLGALAAAQPISKLAAADRPELTELLENRRIETWFQPIVDARTLQVGGYECLMRGRTKEGRLVMPHEMLSWAVDQRMVFMLDRVCREIHLRNAGTAIASDQFATINFLPSAIYRPEYCLRTSMKAAQESGLRPEQIIFEVVETEQMKDREHLSGILAYYRKAGFRVALDDLGSGYAGLSMLADLRPDLIKLDREMVVKAVHSSTHRGVCAALVQIAREQGRPILAEGVETVEQKTLFDELGVDYYQGYLFGKPAPEPLRTVELLQH